MIDQQAFRRLFQAQVSTVTVITAQHEGHRAGLTATAVCSLQDEPPSLVISLNRNANAYRLIAASGRFAVNLLSHSQTAVANRFAKSAANLDEASRKFEEAGDWTSTENDVLVLQGALAAAECELGQLIELQTHVILIGHIIATHHSDDSGALLYANRQYASLREHLETA